MPANIDQMFSVREVPWHREGLVLDDYPGSWEEARKLAGLDWEPVEREVLEAADPDKVRTVMAKALFDATLSDQDRLDRLVSIHQKSLRPVPGFKRVVRDDTDATLYCPKDSYTIIGNGEMGEVLEAMLEDSNVKYETAGSLEGGKRVWALVRLDEPIELAGDAGTLSVPFIALTNAHDGSGSYTARATTVRIVCRNTWNAAEMEGERTGATYSFRHTKNWRDKQQEARKALTGARQEFRAYAKLAQDLLGISVTDSQREVFVQRFIPLPPTGVATDRVIGNVESARSQLRGIFNSATTEPVKNTMYGLVQGAGEYLDHVRSARSWETKFNRSVIRPEPLKAKALKLAREVVSA